MPHTYGTENSSTGAVVDGERNTRCEPHKTEGKICCQNASTKTHKSNDKIQLIYMINLRFQFNNLLVKFFSFTDQGSSPPPPPPPAPALRVDLSGVCVCATQPPLLPNPCRLGAPSPQLPVDDGGRLQEPPLHLRRRPRSSGRSMDLSPTKLDYYDDMLKLQSDATILSSSQGEDGRRALVLDRTIFHPQGGGQPSDTGSISASGFDLKFVVQDVRSKDGVVFHYGFFEKSDEELGENFEKGKQVFLYVDESRRRLNSRLHSAGHLLDVCLANVGLGYLKPEKGYHFPNGPFVEYKGAIPMNNVQIKQKELEEEANALISRGMKVSAAVLPYEEAAGACGGSLPDYITKESTPRIVKLGSGPGCPCGGTHVSDITEIKRIEVTQIRTKKGMTKVSYTLGS